jgi:hypothetical protein
LPALSIEPHNAPEHPCPTSALEMVHATPAFETPVTAAMN